MERGLVGGYVWYERTGELVEAAGLFAGGPFADGPTVAAGVTLGAACDLVSPARVRAVPAAGSTHWPPTTHLRDKRTRGLVDRVC